MSELQDIEKVKKYWDTWSLAVSGDYKDHWIDDNGLPLSGTLYSDIAQYIFEMLPKGKNLNILEIGCGTGRITIELSQLLSQDCSVVGIDFSEPQINFAKANNSNSNLNFYNMDILEFKNSTQTKFDFIFLHSVTQYFPSDEYFMEFLNSTYDLLNTGGSIANIDVPITWYLEFMRSKPKTTFTTPIKNIVKKLINYKPKIQNQTSAIEKAGEKEIEVPTFTGYWVDPEVIFNFCNKKFTSVKMEYQPFKLKPISYRKFRPIFLMINKK